MIFVTGLHQSGTSLLHFLVGALPGYVALGEVNSLIGSREAIARASTSPCSCGHTIASCSFWGDLVPHLKGDGEYRQVFDHFEAKYPGKTMVDSSKKLDVLTQVPAAKVLFCIRDVRGWAVSSARPNLRGFLSWYKGNRRLMSALTNLDYLQVSYDELALRTELSLQRVVKFLGAPYSPKMQEFGHAEHHAVHTNRMKDTPEKMAAIQYDNRWFTEKRCLKPALLLPFVMKFNRENVYGMVPNQFISGAHRKTPKPR